MKKTVYRFDWEKGHTKVRTITRSFDSLHEAERFAQEKEVVDIYRSKGRYVVEWRKETANERQSDTGRVG